MKDFVLTGIFTFVLIFSAEHSYAYDVKAEIAYVKGDAAILPVGTGEERACQPEMVLGSGDRIKTLDESQVMVVFADIPESSVTIGESSDVIVFLDSPDRVQIISGKVYSVIKDLERGSSFKIKTPFATCAVRGTSWMTGVVEAGTEVMVTSGSVYVRGIRADGSVMEKEVPVKRGYQVFVRKNEGPGKTSKVPDENIKAMVQRFKVINVPGGKSAKRVKTERRSFLSVLRNPFEWFSGSRAEEDGGITERSGERDKAEKALSDTDRKNRENSIDRLDRTGRVGADNSIMERKDATIRSRERFRDRRSDDRTSGSDNNIITRDMLRNTSIIEQR